MTYDPEKMRKAQQSARDLRMINAGKRALKVRCSRCDQPWDQQDDWNAELKSGFVVAVLCPACQSPEENAEAVINEATVAYQDTKVFRT